MNICFHNSTRNPIVALHDMRWESQECISFGIEMFNAECSASINGNTEKKVFRMLYDGLEKLYNDELTDIHIQTTDGTLDIVASVNMAGIISWTFILTEVGTRNRMEIKDCSDRTFLPEIMKSLTEWIGEDGV